MPLKQIVTEQKVNPAKIARAQEFRHAMTPAEARLWSHLRANRLGGYHFRRQQIIEPYIVDFYCHRAALVVEVDGIIHQEQKEHDNERDQKLQELGLQVLRFTNEAIIQNLDGVLNKILQACIDRSQG
jgi:very-short-patch-repair endonuclease